MPNRTLELWLNLISLIIGGNCEEEIVTLEIIAEKEDLKCQKSLKFSPNLNILVLSD